MLGAALAAGLAAPAAPGQIRFTDATAGAGLDWAVLNSAEGDKYQVETMLGGLGVIDFDSDGWMDLYVANGAELPSLRKTGAEYWNRLYRNRGDGAFEDVTERAGVEGAGYSMGVAVADYDNDGDQDLYVCGVNRNTLYRNNGDGTFSDVTEAARVDGVDSHGDKLWSVAAAWLDYDRDGLLDLFLSNYCDWAPGLDLVCGGLADGSRTYCHPDSYRGQTPLLYRNRGDGSFEEVSAETRIAVRGKGMGVSIGDFDNDGYSDIFVANDNHRNFLFRNLGNGRFKEQGVPIGVAFNGDGRFISGMGADFRDFDGDSLPDIVMTGLKRETFELFRNQDGRYFEDFSLGSGMVALSRPWSGWGCGLVDFDSDGLLDFFTANGDLDADDPQPNRIFRNVGGGSLRDVSAASGVALERARLHRGVAFADFDNDGRVDAALTALNERPVLLRNVSSGGHWLWLALEGTESNRSALGARVEARVAGVAARVRTIANSVGYASASDLRLHLGLGDVRRVEEIRVVWPSGREQTFRDVAAGQTLRIVEPGQ